MKPFSYACFAFAAISHFENAFAVPGPLVSGGIGILSNAGAFLAIFVGFVAMSASFIWMRLHVWRSRSPKTFAFALSAITALLVAGGIFTYRSWNSAPEDPLDSVRGALASRSSGIALDEIPFPILVKTLAVSPNAASTPEDPKLEAELSFSIGRNNNVVWNRYLASGKVPLDEKTVAEIRSGSYEMGISEFFSGTRLRSDLEIIDLRTPLEYETSAHFQNSRNVEYRSIMNDEVPFDTAKTYAFVCHDGTSDLSRSLIATAYLRSKGYRTYALKTGMRPVLERLWIRPARFSGNIPFAVATPEDPNGTEGIFVDTLWALRRVLSEKKYPSGYETFDFPFYRMPQSEYGKKTTELASFLQGGKKVRFACYDTFSCFYARVFLEEFRKDFPVADLELRIFR